MPIKEINNNGKSKIISSKTGVMNTPNHGHSDKAHSSAVSHSSTKRVTGGHAKHPNTGGRSSSSAAC